MEHQAETIAAAAECLAGPRERGAQVASVLLLSRAGSSLLRCPDRLFIIPRQGARPPLLVQPRLA